MNQINLNVHLLKLQESSYILTYIIQCSWFLGKFHTGVKKKLHSTHVLKFSDKINVLILKKIVKTLKWQLEDSDQFDNI